MLKSITPFFFQFYPLASLTVENGKKDSNLEKKFAQPVCYRIGKFKQPGDLMKYQKIATEWREQQADARAQSGVVLIWDDQVYGWKNELRDPQHERPGAVAVAVDGQVFRATGGNDEAGAEQWREVREAQSKPSFRLR